ncbi:unnamed protein product, partial [Bubo scandiacus]
ICLCHYTIQCPASQILTNSGTEDRKMASEIVLIGSEVLVHARKSPVPSHEPSSNSQLVQMGMTHCTARGYNEVSHSSFSSPFVQDNPDCRRFLR